MNDLPANLLAAVRHFSDLSVCNALMWQIKWPEGDVCCHRCGSVRVLHLRHDHALRRRLGSG